MTRGARYLYAGLAWAFVAGVVVQVFFIGLGLFAGSENIELHQDFGWILHLVPILILVAAAVARAGRRQILLAAGLAVTVFIVPILATLRADLPVVAALHPVGALLAFLLAIMVALGATDLVRGSDEDLSAATPAYSGNHEGRRPLSGERRPFVPAEGRPDQNPRSSLP